MQGILELSNGRRGSKGAGGISCCPGAECGDQGPWGPWGKGVVQGSASPNKEGTAGFDQFSPCFLIITAGVSMSQFSFCAGNPRNLAQVWHLQVALFARDLTSTYLLAWLSLIDIGDRSDESHFTDEEIGERTWLTQGHIGN